MVVKVGGTVRLVRYLAATLAAALVLSMVAPVQAGASVSGTASRPGPDAHGQPRVARPALHTVRRVPALARGPKGVRTARVSDVPMRRRPAAPARAMMKRFARMERSAAGHDQSGSGGPAAPLAREAPGLAYDEANHELVMFGGSQVIDGFLNNTQDTWTWDGVAWRQQFPATVPDASFGGGPAMAYDRARHYVLMVSDGKTYTWDGSNWTQLSPAQSPPIAGGATMVYDDATGTDVLFGGDCVQTGTPGCDDPNSTTSDATWTWDGSNWTLASTSGPGWWTFCSPTAMTYDAATQQVVLDTTTFCTGSLSNPPTSTSTWLWNGQSWQATGTHPPFTLNEPGSGSLVYDPAAGNVVYHVLTCSLPVPQDCSGTELWQYQTLAWDGQQWSVLPTQELATPAQASSVVYDPAASEVVEFGGNLLDTPARPESGSTYAFTGSTWTDLDAVPAGELPSPGPDTNRPHCDCGQPIDTASGSFWHDFTDFLIPGRGIGLQFSRSYNSIDSGRPSPLGFGWTDTYSPHLSIDASTGDVTLFNEDGGAITFTKVASGALEAPSQVLSTLTAGPDGTYTLTRHDNSQLSFDASGRLTTLTDRNGYQTTLTYSGAELAEVTDPAGRSLTFSYDADGNLTSVTDPLGRTVKFSHDASGNLTSATDAGGGTWTFSYDGAHRMLTMTGPRGGTWTNQYDPAGRIISQTDPLQRTTTLGYQDGQTTMTDPRGIVTTLGYANGELMSRSVSTGQGQSATWNYSYNADLSPSTVTDPNGNTTQAITDGNGNVISQTNARFQSTMAAYNAFNEPTFTLEPNFSGTSYSYDGNGNLTQQITEETTGPATTSYTYGDPAHPGDVTAVTDPNGKTWNYGYDTFGDQSSVTDPVGDVTTKTYDLAGRLTSVTQPNGNVPGADPAKFTTSYGYDPLDNLTSVEPPLADGSAMTYTYDADSNLTSATDASGNRTGYSYDADNELTRTTRPDGSVLTATYDADGNVTSRTDGAGQTTSYSYDALNHLASSTGPLQRTTQYAYDPVGNLVQLTDASGQTTSYGYDRDNNLTSISYSDGTTPGVSFRYDNLDQRASMTDGTGTTSYSRDSLGRITSVTNGAGATVGYSYDADGNLTTITYPGGTNQVTRTYDDADRLASVADWLGNTVTFGHDADGNLTSASYPGNVTRSMTYDNLDRLAGITVSQSQNGSQNTLWSASYTRTDAGLLASAGGTGLQTSYGYDPNSRLQQASTPGATTSYSYDNADQLTSIGGTAGTSTLSYDASGELQSVTSGTTTSFGYDANGNRTTTTPAGQPAITAGYDQANRLTSWGTTASYSYNGDGLRTSKTVSGTSEPFTWDLTQPAPALLQDGSTSFIDGPGGQPLEQVNADGTAWYLQPDQLGSTRLLTDTSGAVVASYSYDAYGNTTASSGTASTPLRYAGQYLDPESGLYYLRARYYDPATAQFVTRDPLTASTGQPYAYTADDPVNATDPSGDFPCFSFSNLFNSWRKPPPWNWPPSWGPKHPPQPGGCPPWPPQGKGKQQNPPPNTSEGTEPGSEVSPLPPGNQGGKLPPALRLLGGALIFLLALGALNGLDPATGEPPKIPNCPEVNAPAPPPPGPAAGSGGDFTP